MGIKQLYNDNLRKLPNEYGGVSVMLIEADTKFLHTKGLLAAKALVCPTTGTVPIRIANPYAQRYKLFKDTIVASYEPVEPEQLVSVSKVQSEEYETYSERDLQ